MALDHSCQVQRRPRSERKRDEYDTSPVALAPLLDVEDLGDSKIFEAACGQGNLALELRARGFDVVASDISARGCPDSTVANFFDVARMPPGCDVLLTNPPYYCVERFVRHAFTLQPRLLVLLLRLAFLEARRRTDILEGAGLARVHVFDRQLPMMHRAGSSGRKGNSGMAFAWFIWQRGHFGPTTIDRIRWDTAQLPLFAPAAGGLLPREDKR